MKALGAAIRLLTVLPLGDRASDTRAIERSPAFFPLVGMLVGGFAALAFWLAFQVTPPFVAATIGVAVSAGLTGAFHLDGLADTADGLFGGRTPERRLAIMKDPRNGAYGMVAIALVLVLKVAVIGSVGSMAGWTALLLSPVCGRAAVVVVMSRFRYVREGGLGSTYGGRSRLIAVGSLLSAVLITGLFGGLWGITLLAAALALGMLIAKFASSRLGGGITGDVYGAVSEIGEAAAMLCVAVLAESTVELSPAWS